MQAVLLNSRLCSASRLMPSSLAQLCRPFTTSRIAAANNAVDAEPHSEQDSSSIEYPRRVLSHHERNVFVVEEPQFQPLPDKGYRFFTKPEQLEHRNEMVKRALSTDTASISEFRAFRRMALQNKYGESDFDSGSNRVQSMLIYSP